MPSEGVPVYEGDGASEDILVEQTFQLMAETYPDLFTTDEDRAEIRDQIKSVLTAIVSTRTLEREIKERDRKREEEEEKERKHQEALAKAGERLGRGQQISPMSPLGYPSLFKEMGIDESEVETRG